jgi:hypothetical protein
VRILWPVEVHAPALGSQVESARPKAAQSISPEVERKILSGESMAEDDDGAELIPAEDIW